MADNIEQEGTYYDPKEKKKLPKDLSKVSSDRFMIHFNTSLSQVFRGHGMQMIDNQLARRQRINTTTRELSSDSLFRK